METDPCSFSCNFFPSWENCIRWLCFRCRCIFVVLLLLVATVLQQMWHIGLSRLRGSPRSFGLIPKCSHSAAVAFGFEAIYSVKSQLALPLACNSSADSHAALCVMSGAGPCLPHPEGRRDWQEGSCERHEENKQACKWKWSRPAKLSSSFLFIIWFNWLSWQAYLWHKSTISSSLGFLCSDRNLVEA